MCVWIQSHLLHCCNWAQFWPICYEFSEIFVHLWAFFLIQGSISLGISKWSVLGIIFLHSFPWHLESSTREKFDPFLFNVSLRKLWLMAFKTLLVLWRCDLQNIVKMRPGYHLGTRKDKQVSVYHSCAFSFPAFFERLIWILFPLHPNFFWSLGALMKSWAVSLPFGSRN